MKLADELREVATNKYERLKLEQVAAAREKEKKWREKGKYLFHDIMEELPNKLSEIASDGGTYYNYRVPNIGNVDTEFGAVLNIMSWGEENGFEVDWHHGVADWKSGEYAFFIGFNWGKEKRATEPNGIHKHFYKEQND